MSVIYQINLPNIIIVGFASKAVDESRERIRGAFATSRIMLPLKRITVNLALADIPKADSGFDLAIAVAMLLTGGQLVSEIGKNRHLSVSWASTAAPELCAALSARF